MNFQLVARSGSAALSGFHSSVLGPSCTQPASNIVTNPSPTPGRPHPLSTSQSSFQSAVGIVSDRPIPPCCNHLPSHHPFEMCSRVPSSFVFVKLFSYYEISRNIVFKYKNALPAVNETAPVQRRLVGITHKHRRVSFPTPLRCTCPVAKPTSHSHCGAATTTVVIFQHTGNFAQVLNHAGFFRQQQCDVRILE